MPAAPRDPEIVALDTLISVLEPLDDAARSRVLDYAMRRLGMRELIAAATQPGEPSRPETLALPSVMVAAPATDIRTLREQKAPATVNEMAALVAYYLQELAPEDDRKQAITAADLNRLFKQAGFPLPSRMANALTNAAAAGYFDSTGTRGEYKLNPVGFNLVTQTLPRGPSTSTRPAARKRSGTKSSARKKRTAKSAATARKKTTAKSGAASRKRATKKRAE
jgi:hypothetical protein